jgi:ankyrin repeat protein
MRFIAEGNIEAATLWIKEEANISGVDDKGWTLLIYCARYGTTTEIAELLMEKGVRCQ